MYIQSNHKQTKQTHNKHQRTKKLFVLKAQKIKKHIHSQQNDDLISDTAIYANFIFLQ